MSNGITTISEEELILWRVEPDRLMPKAVKCPRGRFPARDAEGQVVDPRTHFDDPESAWAAMLDALESKRESAVSRLALLRDDVEKAAEDVIAVSLDQRELRSRHEAWKRMRLEDSHSPTTLP